MRKLGHIRAWIVVSELEYSSWWKEETVLMQFSKNMSNLARFLTKNKKLWCQDLINPVRW